MGSPWRYLSPALLAKDGARLAPESIRPSLSLGSETLARSDENGLDSSPQYTYQGDSASVPQNLKHNQQDPPSGTAGTHFFENSQNFTIGTANMINATNVFLSETKADDQEGEPPVYLLSWVAQPGWLGRQTVRKSWRGWEARTIGPIIEKWASCEPRERGNGFYSVKSTSPGRRERTASYGLQRWVCVPLTCPTLSGTNLWPQPALVNQLWREHASTLSMAEESPAHKLSGRSWLTISRTVPQAQTRQLSLRTADTVTAAPPKVFSEVSFARFLNMTTHIFLLSRPTTIPIRRTTPRSLKGRLLNCSSGLWDRGGGHGLWWTA